MNDVFEIIHTTRAMRRLKPDPVPDDLIRKILEAGVCAANGGNYQRWRFLVLRDPAVKKAVQVWYKKAFDEVVGPRYASSPPPPGVSKEKYARQHHAVEYLTEHYHEAPVWIVACLDEGKNTPSRSSGASIYPAVQNLLLACRAEGLGCVLTTLLCKAEPAVRTLLEIPPAWATAAFVPIGWPASKGHGPLTRRPVERMAFGDRFGGDLFA